ncbi:hypothetical protein PFLUV_G00046070 [Perca fluviatilis]|uniref:Uncharacterized protein n=1 Tax=Perca fluviatilis TaxID=8168 RepID=A0A6A5FM64_PERFL|nr:hypothetical protein PFLUV_G00046070 [Perca fluviatilis]
MVRQRSQLSTPTSGPSLSSSAAISGGGSSREQAKRARRPYSLETDLTSPHTPGASTTGRKPNSRARRPAHFRAMLLEPITALRTCPDVLDSSLFSLHLGLGLPRTSFTEAGREFSSL